MSLTGCICGCHSDRDIAVIDLKECHCRYSYMLEPGQSLYCPRHTQPDEAITHQIQWVEEWFGEEAWRNA